MKFCHNFGRISCKISRQTVAKKCDIFDVFCGKKWCKIAGISIDFLLKIYPKMMAVEMDFPPWLATFFTTKNKVICGCFVGKNTFAIGVFFVSTVV